MAIRTKEFYEFQNKVMENLRDTHLSPNESKYCWTLYRETLGYGNLKAKISGVRISGFTRISKTHVNDTEKRLKSRNIIHVNGKIKGFNLNTDEWEKFQVSGTFEKFQVSGIKVPGIGNKKFQVSGSPLSTKKRKLQEGGVGLKKLSYKETEKLEGKKWLKQVLWQRWNFTENFIDRIFKIYSFTQCYDTLIAYEEANNVRDKEAWFLAKLRQGPEPEE